MSNRCLTKGDTRWWRATTAIAVMDPTSRIYAVLKAGAKHDYGLMGASYSGAPGDSSISYKNNCADRRARQHAREGQTEQAAAQEQRPAQPDGRGHGHQGKEPVQVAGW